LVFIFLTATERNSTPERYCDQSVANLTSNQIKPMINLPTVCVFYLMAILRAAFNFLLQQINSVFSGLQTISSSIKNKAI
jgi:hypothetical protein